MSSSTRAPIGFEHEGIGTVLNRYELFVPENQREYAWKADDHVVTLFQDYTEAKSASFSEKRAIYKKAPFTLTSAIAEKDSWTVADIIERQEFLAEIAVKTWPVA